MFTIRSRGTVLLPGIRPEWGERFRIGDLIRLHTPDGLDVVVPIGGIDLFNPSKSGEFAILVATAKEAVPAGTKVWSVQSGDAANGA